MRNINQAIRSLIKKFSRKNQEEELTIYETGVGVKHGTHKFNSAKFVEFSTAEIPFVTAGLDFSDLIFPPDLLKDNYTLCGIPITESPHYYLMQEISTSTLTASSEYLKRKKQGTLDTRLPSRVNRKKILNLFNLRKEEILQKSSNAVTVVRIFNYEKPKSIILDGKHTAALVAYINVPELLTLRIISNGYSYDPFFQRIYSYTLGLNPNHYSKNQRMIRDIFNEPKINSYS